MSWSSNHSNTPVNEWSGPAWICYLGLLKVTLRQKFQNGLSINFLVQNDFKHNKYNKEECHKSYILSFGINNYKTNLLVPQAVIEWRLCNIKVVANWVHRKTFLTCISLSLLAMFSHVVERNKKRENEREKEGEGNPIMRDHHQNPISTRVAPKGPTS